MLKSKKFWYGLVSAILLAAATYVYNNWEKDVPEPVETEVSAPADNQ